MQAIKQEILEKIKENTKVKNRLAYLFDVHITTITRWVKDNDPMLTTASALQAIAEEMEVDKDSITVDSDSINT